jgi:DNA-binding PadR family transcriptional regulator
MSKGLGRVERYVLEELAARHGRGATVRAMLGCDDEVREPALRRAIASLERKGLIARHPQDGKRPRARWLVTAEAERWVREIARQQQGMEEARERLRRAQEEANRRRMAAPQTLARVLGMLGSEHAGERAAAALKAEELRRAMGKTWHQLLQVEP